MYARRLGMPRLDSLRACEASDPAGHYTKSPYYAVQYSILYEPPKADGSALWVLACFHKIRRKQSWTLRRNHPEYERKQLPEEKHYLHNKKPLAISEWLDLCGIDLYENEVRWLHGKLDELPDLRLQPKQTSGQCAAWRIFRDDRTAYLPSFEDFMRRLDFESCRDAWFLEKPIKLKKDRFEDSKAHLLEGTVSKIRLLNVPVTKRMANRRLQRQHSVMVGQRVKHFYGVGHDDQDPRCNHQCHPPRHGDRDTP